MRYRAFGTALALLAIACGSEDKTPTARATGGSATTPKGGAASAGANASGGSPSAPHADVAGAGGAPEVMGQAGAESGAALTCRPEPGLPADAPELPSATWTNLSPPGFPFNDSSCTTGLAVSPCNPSVLYLCTGSFDPTKGGLYRSTNAGATWSKIGRVPTKDGSSDHLEGPNHVRVDPADPQHLYVVEGVRGSTEGFWVSTDGGDSFTMPAGFVALANTEEHLFPFDIYDIDVDPTDFSHILLSHHFGWAGKYEGNSGVLESTDGGNSWTMHEPQDGWGTGHAVNFLFDPEKGIGDADTWLLGTQGNGMWRTTNGGATWTQVTPNAIQHGGGSIYYDKAGVLYVSGTPHNLRSTDNGEHFTEINATAGYTSVFGDGKLLYTRPLFSTGPFLTSPEGGDGMTWTDFSTQQISDGPFEMALDRTNGILYSSTWGAGLLALKLE